MLKLIVNFSIPEFNSLVEVKLNQKINDAGYVSLETTFKHIIYDLPKRIKQNWESVEFTRNGQRILVCKHWLVETDNDFENSHEILY